MHKTFFYTRLPIPATIHSGFVTLAASVHTFISPETALHELLKAVIVELEPLVSVSP